MEGGALGGGALGVGSFGVGSLGGGSLGVGSLGVGSLGGGVRMRMLGLGVILGLGCGGSDEHVDPPADAAIDAAAALRANAGPDLHAIVGEVVTLDGSASTGALAYQWSFGDGSGWVVPRTEAIGEVIYTAPGRYQAVLTVIDRDGGRRTDGVSVAVTHPLTHVPRQAASIVTLADGLQVAVVSPDTDEVIVLGRDGVRWRAPTCATPRTVARWDQRLAVACQDGAAVELVGLDGSAGPRLPLPRGARPFGVIVQGGDLWVTLQGTGQLARFHDDGVAITRTLFAALPDARALAAHPDGGLIVGRWRSPDDGARLAVVSASGAPTASITLAVDPQGGSDTEIGGVPSYLDQVLVTPDGRQAIVPSLQQNLARGAYRSGEPLTFETTIRAVISYVDLVAGAEDLERRKQFDDRGLASAGVLTSHGDYLFVVMPGNRSIERLDVLTGAQSGAILDVGYAPAGVALSADDRYLFVDVALSREVVVYDVTSFAQAPTPVARIPIVTAEPLAPQVLLGKRLFHDAADERLAKDGYLACAHCHLEGLDDGRTWDFTDRGEGLRNTVALRGRAGTGDGPVHWSANFDEIQDFEHDIRAAFGGTGLMADADFHAGTRDTPMGDPKAGVSAALDALAAYVASFAELPSPWRQADGALTDAAIRGRAIFAAAGCPACHSGARLTDSALLAPATPRLHDVGTLRPSSGQRLGAPLTGLDTPTLHGLWRSAPYLHDGRAPTLRAVLVDENPADQHGVTSPLTAAEVDDLIAYLRSLDGAAD